MNDDCGSDKDDQALAAFPMMNIKINEAKKNHFRQRFVIRENANALHVAWTKDMEWKVGGA